MTLAIVTTNAEPSMDGLHVVGKHILNNKNEIIQLRGANRPGTEYSCVQYQKIFDGPSDNEHVLDMKKWNMNAVRVPLNEDCWLGTNAKETEYFGKKYVQAITAYVNSITDANMAVILDLHWAADGGGSILAEKQIPMPNKKQSPTFWIGIQYATSLTKFLTYMPTDPIGQLGAAIHSYDFNYCRSRGCWDYWLKPVFDKYPIVATETGQKDCQTDFIRDFLHYCDQNNLHYLAWSWLVAECDNPSLIVDYDGKPSNYGKGVKAHLMALADGKEAYYTDTFDVFNDKMTHWFEDWSSAEHSLNSTTVVQEGKYSISYEPKAGKSLHFRCWGCIQTDIHKQIEFQVHGGEKGSQVIDFDLLKLKEDQTNDIVQSYKLDSLVGGAIPAGKWVKVIVDLTKLPKGMQYDGLWLKPDADQPNMYVDKITVRALYEPPVPAGEEYGSSMASITSKSASLAIILASIVAFVLFA
eukprot:gene13423-15817_t